jgi:hypothetical protein
MGRYPRKVGSISWNEEVEAHPTSMQFWALWVPGRNPGEEYSRGDIPGKESEWEGIPGRWVTFPGTNMWKHTLLPCNYGSVGSIHWVPERNSGKKYSWGGIPGKESNWELDSKIRNQNVASCRGLLPFLRVGRTQKYEVLES